MTGATGFIGSHVVSHLLSRGYTVSALVRDAKSAVEKLEGADLCEGQLSDTPSLARCFQNCDAVVHCVGIHREDNSTSFESVHTQGTRNLVSALHQSHVTRVVHLSFLQARPFLSSPYHHTKWQAEELLRDSGLEYTVLKPGIVFGKGDGFSNGIRRTLNIAPFFAVPPGSTVKLAPLYVGDLAEIVEYCLSTPETKGKTFPLVGPTSYSLREIVEVVGDKVGVSPSFLPVPIPLQRFAAVLMKHFMSEPLVSDAQLTILSEPLDAPIIAAETLPDEARPRTPFQADFI